MDTNGHALTLDEAIDILNRNGYGLKRARRSKHYPEPGWETVTGQRYTSADLLHIAADILKHERRAALDAEYPALAHLPASVRDALQDVPAPALKELDWYFNNRAEARDFEARKVTWLERYIRAARDTPECPECEFPLTLETIEWDHSKDERPTPLLAWKCENRPGVAPHTESKLTRCCPKCTSANVAEQRGKVVSKGVDHGCREMLGTCADCGDTWVRVYCWSD
jgi:hypothetical protein